MLYFVRVPLLMGGPNVFVNMNESLFRHSAKYHVGRHTEHEIRVLGIVDTSFIPIREIMVRGPVEQPKLC